MIDRPIDGFGERERHDPGSEPMPSLGLHEEDELKGAQHHSHHHGVPVADPADQHQREEAHSHPQGQQGGVKQKSLGEAEPGLEKESPYKATAQGHRELIERTMERQQTRLTWQHVAPPSCAPATPRTSAAALPPTW